MPIGENPRIDHSRLAPSFQVVDVSSRVEVYPCTECDLWVVVAERAGDRVVLREWHAKDCPRLQTPP